MTTMNASQERAAALLRRLITADLDKNPERGDQIVQWEVKEGYGGTFSIAAKTLMTGLPEGNLLRAVSSDYWLVFIGKHGKLTVSMGPKSLEQFHGRMWCGMHIECDPAKARAAYDRKSAKWAKENAERKARIAALSNV